MLSEGSIVTICGMVVTIATLYFQNKRNAENSKARSADLKDTIDGKVTTLIKKVEAEGDLKVQVAALTATAAEKAEGEIKANLAALQHGQRVADLRDEKIANGEKIEVRAQPPKTPVPPKKPVE